MGLFNTILMSCPLCKGGAGWGKPGLGGDIGGRF